ncbi:hypothetical protein, partial [Escherichia coli]
MTQKIEQSQRQERVAAWNRRAECDSAAFHHRRAAGTRSYS